MNSPLLGLDIGLKRTGVAISEHGLIASPLSVLQADPPHLNGVIASIISLVKDREIAALVVGLPLTSEGQATAQSQLVTRLVQRLEHALSTAGLSVEIITINEFYSSEEARQAFPDAPLDAASAAVILQHFLDTSHA